MKIIAIGDIHGRDTWKKINVAAYDKIVFIGDYVDSPHILEWVIMENFKEIITLKKAFPEKIVLLLGNHDIQYVFFPDYPCSGLMKKSQRELTELFVTNKDLFLMAYQVQNYLFTHAGVSRKWYSENADFFKGRAAKVGEVLNEMYFVHQAYYELFQIGRARGGFERVGGIIWADKRETEDEPLFGYHQIVGHSKVQKIEVKEWEGLRTSITYIDVLTHSDTFYEIEI